MATSVTLTDSTFSSPRHATHYWQVGPVGGPLMIFLHGWPQIGLVWRAQMEAFASEGWHCIAPDMRGYGGSTAPTASQAYALKEIVDDMVELHDHLGASPAIWVGHDLGCPVVGALAAHHAKRSRGVVFISVPYAPQAFALPNLLPLIDRKLYPADHYPDGQWDYYRFYLTHFDQTVTDFNADIPASLAAVYRSGNPESVGKVYRSSIITRNGGWFGSAHHAPAVQPDPALWPTADFDALVEAFRVTGFQPGNSWYLNDSANIAYASAAPDGGRLRQPVLFINGDFDGLCDITYNRFGEPMRNACQDLTVTNLPSGHWLPLERKAEVTQALQVWLETKALSFDGNGATLKETMNTLITSNSSSPLASMKINHAAIRVPDFDTAVAWYADKLDFRLKQSVSVAGLSFGFLYPAGDDSFHFELMAGPDAAERPTYKDLHDSYNMSGWHHPGFIVESVDAVIDELKRRDVTIASEPHDVAAMGLRVAFFADPWGNLFEVIQSITQ